MEVSVCEGCVEPRLDNLLKFLLKSVEGEAPPEDVKIGTFLCTEPARGQGRLGLQGHSKSHEQLRLTLW